MNSAIKFSVFFAINLAVIFAVMKALDSRGLGGHSSADLERVALKDYANGKFDFDLLAATEFSETENKATFAGELAALDGKQVELIGFMMPATEEVEFREFILVNFPTGCKICPVETRQEQVFAEVAADHRAPGKIKEMVRVRGRLLLSHVNPVFFHPMLNEFLFVIDEAEVSEFVDE